MTGSDPTSGGPGETAPAASGYRLLASPLAGDSFGDGGLRSFFAFRDSGLSDATGGDFACLVVRAKPGRQATTGWHYHDCRIHVVYCLAGWEDIQFDDGHIVHLEPGTVLSIPPGRVHNEIGYSDDFEALIFIGPSKFETVDVAEPAAITRLHAGAPA